MNGIAAIVSLLLLAGCTGSDGAGSPADAPMQLAPVADGPPVDWSTSFGHDTVEVELVDPRNHYRVLHVRLVEPNGRSHEAAELTRTVIRDRASGWSGRPSVGIGGVAGSHYSGFGIGLSFPLGQSGGRQEPAGYTSTEARIAVPDPGHYRRTAQSWTIDVILADPSGAERFARIPAPLPRS